MTRRTTAFQTIRSEGGLLPTDLLRRILDPKEKLSGTSPQDYGLPESERINEVITQSWNRLRKHWTEFRNATVNLKGDDPGTSITNNKWSLPLCRELGFGLIPTAAGPEIEGRSYPINRFVGPFAIHLVGCGVSLDSRAAGVKGASTGSPHGLVQEFINRSPGHLWAIVSNGLRLRVLRDSQTLSRQSYLEFDLEPMFAGEVYSDFVLLWLVCHATRFAPRDNNRPESCWLEEWSKYAAEQGTRALGELKGGVEKALQILGQGFTSHPKNTSIRESLRSGKTTLPEFHGQLLRVVYRLIFLFVAEDRTIDGRPLLHPIDNSAEGCLTRERYEKYYSTARLRELANTIKGSRHGDLWKQLQLLVGALSGDSRFVNIRQQLALPSLGSFLWDPSSTRDLNNAEVTNFDFLEALRNLAFTRQGSVLRPVDYKNLGSEELGGVYESLLALTPQINGDGTQFTFAEFAGNERKTSGSYYTPDSLVQCLLDSALDPVVDESIRNKSAADAEKAILELKVCDPAVGSGHFLVGAAHRLAGRLARVRAQTHGDGEPSPLQYQRALRDVIGRCLYGVDINPMSAELCRVSLWLEALEPGKPLSFLDHHIRVGNSLLGTTPDLIAKDIPDEAYEPIEGDDKKVCATLKKQNRLERSGQRDMLQLMVAEPKAVYGSLADRAASIESLEDNSLIGIREKQSRFQALTQSPDYQHSKLVADAWCAAFVWRKTNEKDVPACITTDAFRRLRATANELSRSELDEVQRLRDCYQFFQWHIAFPEVCAQGGFNVTLGNPPWERVKLAEKEWFAKRHPDIANATNASARKRMIETLRFDEPVLYQEFMSDSRKAEGESHVLRNSGLYPLCGGGDINLYAVFAEAMRRQLCSSGHMGAVLPSGIATDDTTKLFFQDIVEKNSLRSLFDFENRKGLFPDVDSRMKFCLFTSGSAQAVTRGRTLSQSEFAFFCLAVDDLQMPEKRFSLSRNDITLVNPNTRTCPIFRSLRDAEITKAIYRRIPVFIRDAQGGQPEHNPWGFDYMTKMFDMADSSHEFIDLSEALSGGWIRMGLDFVDSDDVRYTPLYEAKHIHLFDHRWGSGLSPLEADSGEVDKCDANSNLVTRYWVPRRRVDVRLSSKQWTKDWLLGWRDITNTTNERTCLISVFPRTAVAHTLRVAFVEVQTREVATLIACLSSYMFDFLARQKVGGTHLTVETLKQLPVLRPEGISSVYSSLIFPRVLELTYTAWDMEGFALDCGFNGPPFRWDEERRFLARCELDAAFFHLYLGTEIEWRKEPESLTKCFDTPRDAVSYIMETFPIVKRKDEAKWGEYRTKRVILEIYDEMTEAMRSGKPYQTRLDPPPGDPRCCHPARH